MRLKEDNNMKEVEREEEEMMDSPTTISIGGGGLPQNMNVVVVGYALTSKKIKSFLQPKLEGLASTDTGTGVVPGTGPRQAQAVSEKSRRLTKQSRTAVSEKSRREKVDDEFRPNKGILFVAIDQTKPLSDQGPFDIVLHKLSGKEWGQLLEVECLLCCSLSSIMDHDLIIEVSSSRFQENEEIFFPRGQSLTLMETGLLDPPDAIKHVYNRQSMLQDVADLNLCDVHGTVGVPRQLVIKKDPSSIPDAVTKAGLILPLVAKPLVAKSHELSLAYDQYSLKKLEPPLVLQEFVNHGGVLFKVYIVGEAIKVVRRFSLPDVSKRDLSRSAGVYRFPRVSCAAASADDADLDPCIAELPPRPLLERLARELRRRLGLRLFNLDMIREHGTRDRFYVIDINYFPGYGKMPEYEHIFTDFLLNLAQSKYHKRSVTPIALWLGTNTCSTHYAREKERLKVGGCPRLARVYEKTTPHKQASNYYVLDSGIHFGPDLQAQSKGMLVRDALILSCHC
ncbi:hypothetical protein LguiB_017421 [Lonicera macranthoides]